MQKKPKDLVPTTSPAAPDTARLRPERLAMLKLASLRQACPEAPRSGLRCSTSVQGTKGRGTGLCFARPGARKVNTLPELVFVPPARAQRCAVLARSCPGRSPGARRVERSLCGHACLTGAKRREFKHDHPFQPERRRAPAAGRRGLRAGVLLVSFGTTAKRNSPRKRSVGESL